ncbi:MAG: hypothetical protein J6Q65_06120, partial [Lentisphaeria bacterium]|nr:hypothetical protein [Lentisphaeria bacterium]
KEKMMKMYGVDVFQVDIVSLGVPEKTAEAIAATMRQERETMAKEVREKGKAEADKIRIQAERDKELALTEAEAKAKDLRAQGDAAAAESYRIFSADPKLAAFLQKLDALKKTLGNQTTLILHTGNVPFDIFEAPMGKQEDDTAQPVPVIRKRTEKRSLEEEEQDLGLAPKKTKATNRRAPIVR